MSLQPRRELVSPPELRQPVCRCCTAGAGGADPVTPLTARHDLTVTYRDLRRGMGENGRESGLGAAQHC